MGGSDFIIGILFVFISSWTFVPGNGERILFVLPIASKSMANVFEPMVRGLAERGHELTVVTPVKFDIHNSKGKSHENVTQLIPVLVDDVVKNYPNPFDIRREGRLFSFPLPFIEHGCHKSYENEEFQKIGQEKFDLVIMNMIYNDCFAGLFHKMGKVPIIQVGSLPVPSPMLELFGNHHPSSFIPIVVLGDIAAQLNFIQRTKNFLYNLYFTVMLEVWTRPPQEVMYRKYLQEEDLPSVREIYKEQVSMVFMNSHFSITRVRPLLPSVLEIGGIHCQPSKPLPKDLEDFVSGAKDGFIVFSMGSIVRAVNMPESVRLAFVRTFAKLKQRVIWKWEKDGGMPDVPSNVKLVKWLPQQDLLGHPNIRLFITHGGLLSTEEAIYHGVPVLGMPVFVDQDANMKHAEDLGFGVKGEILDLTELKLQPLVRRMLDDPRYMQRAQELSKIFRDQPQTPLERALYWVEYVLRHKGAYHLRSSGMDLNVFQYHSIDVVLFLVGIFLVIILFAYMSLKLIVKMFTSAMRSEPRKKHDRKVKRQ